MPRHFVRVPLLLLLAALLAAPCAFADSTALSGDPAEIAPYPYASPYEATIFGTPPDLRLTLPGSPRPEVLSLEVEDRRVPDVFAYNAAMEYSLLLQDHPAPLVFLIAGTGGRYDESKMLFLQQLFYSAGFHTACISSPTQFQFIVSVSRHAIAGYVPWDVDDLWRVLAWVRAEAESRCAVTGFRITGYSLGALHAAFLAERDAHERVYGFERVLMLNPPVDLFSSALNFDSWLGNGEAGMAKAQEAIGTFISEFTEFYKANDLGDLDGEALFRFFETLHLDEEQYKALISSSFRMTCASLVFTSDVCLRAGYVVSPEVELSSTDPLLPYFDVASRITFEEYFEEFLLPYVQFNDPGATRTTVLHECSLRSIARFLGGAASVRVLGTEDDPILDPDELEFLKTTFGDRAGFFTRGGHCGNFQYAPFARRILELMRLPGDAAPSFGNRMQPRGENSHV
ncbi:MAG: alpha/beta hydrolase [Desulfovibrio sp.]